jgi:hypothetical protein
MTIALLRWGGKSELYSNLFGIYAVGNTHPRHREMLGRESATETIQVAKQFAMKGEK